MSAFRKPAEMFVAYPKFALLPHAYTDNSMPKRDWSIYDIPTYKRVTAKVLKFERPALLRRQAD